MESVKFFKGDIVNMSLYIAILFLSTSCIKTLPSQFTDSNQFKKDSVYSIEDIQNAQCWLVTGKTQNQEKPLESQAQQLIIEANKNDAVVFQPQIKNTPSVINNLSFVEYEIQGSDICQKLLNSQKIPFSGSPFSKYPVHFQLTQNMMRIFIEGEATRLPYHQLTGSSYNPSHIYYMPLGGYSIQQGQVRRTKNIENKETHILDFFPNTHSPIKYFDQNKPFVHSIYKDTDSVLVNHQTWMPYSFLTKKDLLPKSYFEGTWYSGVSITSVEPLLAQSVGMSSGTNISGDHYSGFTTGQKVYFQFDAQNLRAINEGYKQQSQELKLMKAAEAEVVSFPIQHRDYKNIFNNFSGDKQLSEEINSNLSWQDMRYVEIDFSRVSHYFKKRIETLSKRYGYFKNYSTIAPSITVREVRWAHDYFDILVYDGQLEYRFSFFKKDIDKTYASKTIDALDGRFEYLSIPDKRAFQKPEDSFKSDHEKSIKLLRVQPNEENQIILHFSKHTPKDIKIRSIGYEAVSLWNQALNKAGLNLSLVIDKSKDVNIGDIRYHVLHIPMDLPIRVLGVAQIYADDDTGEIIASSSTVHLNNIINYLKRMIIYHAYLKYDSFNSSDRMITTRNSIPISKYGLRYFSLQNQLHYLESLPSLNFPYSPDQWTQHLQSLNKNISFIRQAPKNIFNKLQDSLSIDSAFKNWSKELKITYALNTGKFIEEESFLNIQKISQHWSMEKWHESQAIEGGDQFLNVVSHFCQFISNPITQPDKFKSDVQSCANKIYPIYALGTTVHEIGHSIFSLTHNFAGSTDKKNQISNKEYQTHYLKPYFSFKDRQNKIHPIQAWFPSISSSVMDYIHPAHGEQWTPGSYDIAAIQYLYKDLVPHDDSLTVTQTSFHRCADWSEGESSLCLHLDSGDSAEKQALAEIRSLLSILKSNDYFISSNQYAFFKSIYKLMTLYYDWRKKLEHFINQNHLTHSNQISVEDYERILNKIVTQGTASNASLEDIERLSFYRARNLIYHALSYISFIPNFYCVFKNTTNDQEEVIVELSKILKDYRNQTRNIQEDLVSCWDDNNIKKAHPIVQNYVQNHHPHFELKSEVGQSLYPQKIPKNLVYQSMDHSYLIHHPGTYWFRNISFATMTLTEIFFPNNESLSQLSKRPVTMMDEKDIEQAVERLVLSRVTQGAFLPRKKDFFNTLKNTSLENLTPEKSASLLFDFPQTQNLNSLFRDELIQVNKLHPDAINKYKRDDHRSVSFFQNFHEEKKFLKNMIYFYTYGKLTPKRNNIDVTQKGIQSFKRDIKDNFSFTGEILLNKALNYLDFKNNPHLATSYYFDFNNFYITPLNNQKQWGGMGPLVISELAKNSVRQLWTPSNYDRLLKKPQRSQDQSSWETGSLTVLLFYHLQKFTRLQGTRLGRFYFMYMYTLSLGLLEAYEHAVSSKKYSNINYLHKEVTEQLLPFAITVSRLFHYETCSTHSQEEKSSQTLENINCVNGVSTNKGKLQKLYAHYNHFLIQKNSNMNQDINYIFSDLEHFPSNLTINQEKAIVQDQQFNNDITTIEQAMGSLSHHSSYIQKLLRHLFLFNLDTEEVVRLLKIHRQLLVDIIPKLMFMYSSDRHFVGEMMWIVGNMYNACMNGRGGSILCSLQIERLMSYYLSGTLYGSHEKLENSFHKILLGEQPLVENGIPLEDLIHPSPNFVMDQSIITPPLDSTFLHKYLFHERRWYGYRNSVIENQTQRELLLQMLPLSDFQIQNSSHFYNPHNP